jgi:hypothetical protein
LQDICEAALVELGGQELLTARMMMKPQRTWTSITREVAVARSQPSKSPRTVAALRQRVKAAHSEGVIG